MPIDLSAFSDSFKRMFGDIPPILIALVLLMGPTAVLVAYRLIAAARRRQASPEAGPAPLWVCHDCRSVNEIRLARCYRCGTRREATGEIEVIFDRPAGRPTTFEAPAGSPFAALGAMPVEPGDWPGIPVMVDPASTTDGVAVGPGRSTDGEPEPESLAVEGLPSSVEGRR